MGLFNFLHKLAVAPVATPPRRPPDAPTGAALECQDCGPLGVMQLTGHTPQQDTDAVTQTLAHHVLSTGHRGGRAALA